MSSFCFGLIFAASVAAGPISPRFTHLSVDDGLSQSSVEHILQDSRGFLWFGTQEGLNRYDGYRFTVHRARDQAGFLGDHDITALIEDRSGDLWVGTSRGLYRHDLATGRFDRQAPAAAALAIRDLVEDTGGRIFFTASDGRLWTLKPAEPGSGAPVLDGFGEATAITALARGTGASIWAAGDGRLFEVETGRDQGVRVSEALSDLGSISLIVSDRRGDVWIGRPDTELLRYSPADRRVDRFPQVPRGTLAILPAKDGGVWIGARGGGLARLDAITGAVAIYRHDAEDPTSLSRDDVAAIYEDRAGTLWIGAWNGGVNRLDPYAQAFRTFRHRPRDPDSLPADDVIAMTETTDARLWLASRSGRVAAGDPRSGSFRTAATLRDRGRLTAVGQWGSLVLVGTARGMAALQIDSGREVELGAALRAHRLHERTVSAIRTAPGEESVWIASGTTLFRATGDPQSARPVDVQNFQLPLTGGVSALSVVSDRRLWIGSEAGELVVATWTDAGTDVRFRRLALGEGSGPDHVGAHGVISALHEDSRGRLWVGTRRGLGRIEPNSDKVSWLGQPDGLPSTNIAGIAGDAKGLLWVGTNRGLTRIDPDSGAMTHFGEREGAQGKGYAEGAWAASRSGRLYFAGEGVTAFDPHEVRVSPHRPVVVFTALEILHRAVVPRWLDPDSPLERTVDSQDEVTLDPTATVFSVEMVPLHYGDPPRNRLAYRLEGFDPEWIETDASQRVATYTRLAPGRYVLHARAGTKNGLWSEHEATLAIHILPPWWRTEAALAGWCALALVLAGLVWTAARRRTRVRLALLERETLRRQSLTDPLTGLYNRRFLTTFLQHEVPKLLRDHSTAAPASAGSDGDLLLLLIDVDHFKAINDRFSHAAGDRVLTAIATVLRDHIRDSDLAVRWGGDEFLVVARSFHGSGAQDSVDRLRREVEALGQARTAEGRPPCTVSIGYVPFPFLPREPDALTWEQTLDLADHALRLTKRRRRNSYTGLRAGPGLCASAVVEFLAVAAMPFPDGIETVIGDEGRQS